MLPQMNWPCFSGSAPAETRLVKAPEARNAAAVDFKKVLRVGINYSMGWGKKGLWPLSFRGEKSVTKKGRQVEGNVSKNLPSFILYYTSELGFCKEGGNFFVGVP